MVMNGFEVTNKK